MSWRRPRVLVANQNRSQWRSATNVVSDLVPFTPERPGGAAWGLHCQ